MKRASLTSIALLSVVTIVGCGGSKGLSRKELIAKADPICRRSNHALKSSKISLQNLKTVAPAVAVTENEVSSELSKLTPPSSMAADWKVIVHGFHRAGVGLEELAKAAQTSPLSKLSQAVLQDMKEITEGQRDRAVTAGRNGFSDCSEY
jgi:hypothetical protein